MKSADPDQTAPALMKSADSGQRCSWLGEECRTLIKLLLPLVKTADPDQTAPALVKSADPDQTAPAW